VPVPPVTAVVLPEDAIITEFEEGIVLVEMGSNKFFGVFRNMEWKRVLERISAREREEQKEGHSYKDMDRPPTTHRARLKFRATQHSSAHGLIHKKQHIMISSANAPITIPRQV
jgi:hypothetical protein